MSLEVRDIIAKAAIVLVAVLIVGTLVMCLAWHEIGNEIFLHEGRFRYSIETEEARWPVEVLKVVREKGKEDIYVIGLNGSKLDKYELSESQYDAHIGEDGNTITVKKCTLKLWLSQNPFNDDLDSAWLYEATRVQYPWETDPLVEFTDNDARSLVAAFIADGSNDIELPFTCDWWSEFVSRGMSVEKENSKSF